MQARFENGIYRDCKWCHGRGCLSCEAEADKEYQRQFPDGPKPLATFKIEPGTSIEDAFAGMKDVWGPDAIMSAKAEGEKRAKEKIEANPDIVHFSGYSEKECIAGLAMGLTGQIIEERMIEKAKTMPNLAKAIRAAKEEHLK